MSHNTNINITKMWKTKPKKNKMKIHFLDNISTFDLTNEVPYKQVNDITKAKLKSGEYKLLSKNGRSRIWDTFAKVVDGNGKEIENILGCKKCFNVYTFNNTSSTCNLVRHRCYRIANNCPNRKAVVETAINNSSEMIDVDVGTKINNSPVMEVDVEIKIEVDEETIKKGMHIITEWTVKDGRPFSIIDDSGFKNFAEFLITVGAKYGQHVNIDKLLPHPTTISRNISRLYEFHVEEVRNEILMFKNFGYSITSDIWTDNNLKTSYLYLTIHYIKEGTLINRLLAVKSLKEVSSDGVEIKGIINRVLQEFGCDLENDNPTIVSGTGSNMTVAFHGLNNIHCVNHLLHNVIERTIIEVPELLNMVNRCSKIVEYLKESDLNSNLEISQQSYCPTRWNGMYYLFKSIEANWLDISNILEKKNQIYKMQEIDLIDLSSVISLLSRFEISSRKLEENKYPTLHLAIPYINHLKKVCRVDINDVEIVKKCKVVLLDLLQSEVLQSFSKFHNIALFLFPPTNKLLQFTETEKQQTMDDCREVMKVFLNDCKTENVDSISLFKAEENEIFADFCLPYQSNNVRDNINNELQRYQNSNIVFSEDLNILQWWSINKEEYPYLYKTSCKILSAPASSAASEKVFSTVKTLISDKRYIIATNEDMLNKIMFLHSNIENLNGNVLDE